jgi:periplasmic protein TonB
VLTKFFISFSLLLITSLSYAQSSKQSEPVFLYLNVDKIPRFPGGVNALSAFLSKNLKYPDKAIDVQGTVLLSFVVLKNGRISNLIIEKSLLKKFDGEAKRVIGLMPKWIPGEIDNKQVDVKLYFPIDFSIYY